MSIIETQEKKLESRLRRKLRRDGFMLKKDRARPSRSVDHLGGYMIIDAQFNRVEAGERFSLTLEDVAKFTEDEPLPA